MDPNHQYPKRRRVIFADDEEEEIIPEYSSNPDETFDDILSDEAEGEDLMENWISDYAPADNLDQYDPADLASENDDKVSESFENRMRDRISAEKELDALDMKRRDRDIQTENNLERMTRFEQQELDIEEEDEEEDVRDGALNLEAFDCPLREWLVQERTRIDIKRRFKEFLLYYYIGIDDVARWKKKNEIKNPMPQFPHYLKVSLPIYPEKIKFVTLTSHYYHNYHLLPQLFLSLL